MAQVLILANSKFDKYLNAIFSDANCIDSYTEEKIYFRKDKIIFSENGCYLNLQNNQKLPLPLLAFDKGNYFLHISRATMNSVDREFIQCPYCGTWRRKWTSHCINPDCPLS
jgi:hypothetical protein